MIKISTKHQISQLHFTYPNKYLFEQHCSNIDGKL